MRPWAGSWQLPTAGASGDAARVLFALKKHKMFGAGPGKALVVAGGIGQVIASRASLAGTPPGGMWQPQQPWLPEP